VVTRTKSEEVKRKKQDTSSTSIPQKAGPISDTGSPAEHVLHIQRTAGNRAVQRLVKSHEASSKLRSITSGSVYPQKADKTATKRTKETEKEDKKEKESEKTLKGHVQVTSVKMINDAIPMASTMLNAAIKHFDLFDKIIKLILNDKGDKSRYRQHHVACRLLSNFNIDITDTGDTEYLKLLHEIRKTLGHIQSQINNLGPATSKNILPGSAGSKIVCAAGEDTRCEKYGAFVVGNKPPIYLCPSWFLGRSARRRAVTLIHEAAHLAGLPRGKYIKEFSGTLPRKSCKKKSRFDTDQNQTVKNPDSYAYFAADFYGYK
jgi:hypothetical protein